MRFDPKHTIKTSKKILKATFGSLYFSQKMMTADTTDMHYLDFIFGLQESLDETILGENQFEFLLGDPNFKSILDEFWIPPYPDLEKLSKLPKGSLGWVYANNLINEGYTPDRILSIDPYPINSIKEFTIHRIWQTHDYIHALTGFDINETGEIGLLAFTFANTHSPVAQAAMTGALMRYAAGKSSDYRETHSLSELCHSISIGLGLGIKCSPVIGFKLEEMVEIPIVELREKLNLPISVNSSLPFMREDDF